MTFRKVDIIAHDCDSSPAGLVGRLVFLDDPRQSDFLQKVLEGWGCRFGNDAPGITGGWQAQKVFINYIMIEKYGASLKRLMKSTPCSSRIPIICYSLDRDIGMQAHKWGAEGWIGMPLRLINLYTVALKPIFLAKNDQP